MTRAFDLALNGLGKVSPNPLVGCVIVYHDEVIGEGWHQDFGGPHAEVNAIGSVADVELLEDSTVYVNLEPCSHHGKTPPCSDLLIESQVKRVIIANGDPNPLVAGKGISRLRNAGIKVDCNILPEKGRELNKRFFTFHETQKPYVILKWAQTQDGFIARENFDSKWISGELSRKLVHKWRAEEDAILVGRGTVLHDNPKLDVRDWSGADPVRIVIDPKLQLEGSYHIFDQKGKTLVYNLESEKTKGRVEYIRLVKEDFIAELLKDLYENGVGSVMVEGGGITLDSFIDSGLWNEARVFEASKTFDKGIKAPIIDFAPSKVEMIGKDKLLYFRNEVK